MKRIKLFFVAAVFLIVSFVFFSQDAEAYQIEVKKDGLYSDSIPNEVFQGLDSCVENFLEISAEKKRDTDGQEGIELKRDAKVVLCRPYVEWSIDPVREASVVVYNFLVVADSKIIAILDRPKAINADGIGEGFTTDSIWIEKLNEIDYLHQDFVFYEYQGDTYAESARKRVQINMYSHENLYADVGGIEARKPEEDAFLALNYEEKVNRVLQDMDEMTERFFGAQLEEAPDDAKSEKEIGNAFLRYLFFAGLGVGGIIGALLLWRFWKKKSV
jgi:hypothetical protein